MILLNNPHHTRKPLLFPVSVLVELRKLLELVVEYPCIIRKKNHFQIESSQVKRQQITKFILHLLTYIARPSRTPIDLKF